MSAARGPRRGFLPLLALLIPALSHAAGAGAPADLEDGLLVAAPADVSLHRAPFESLTPAGIASNYPDTTSVLVYRNERLVFERYFGSGSINSLNNPRSASKTVPMPWFAWPIASRDLSGAT